MDINAKELNYLTLNQKIRETDGNCSITECLGQRFIGAGMSGRQIEISGIPGNAMGAYLNGAEITVKGNAQDAVGDTMNNGKIVIQGSVGDAVGYAMRGGEIYIKDNAGYRAGIHMKEYKEKKPVMVIGGCTGSFLGEYQAGGLIIILGMNKGQKPTVGNFPCTGMHGGKVFLRGDLNGVSLPKQVSSREATAEDINEIQPYIDEYCRLFGFEQEKIMSEKFTVIFPDSKNPYKQMYVQN